MSEEHVAIMMFADFDTALAARKAIIEQNAPDVAEVSVEVRDDEAGPVESNFVIGNKRHDGKQTGEYDEQFRPPAVHGAIPLIAWCSSDDAVARVKAHLRELGGRDVQV
jgi:hypothetical protein